MKKMKQLGYYVLATFLLTACQSYKKVPYLQDAEVVLYNTQDAELYDAKIMPKDLRIRQITVQSHLIMFRKVPKKQREVLRALIS